MIRNKLMPWQMAQARKAAVVMATLPLMWSQVFWMTWAEVMFPEGRK